MQQQVDEELSKFALLLTSHATPRKAGDVMLHGQHPELTGAKPCRPESLDMHMDYRGMGVLLALAHEFDMPALTLRIKRMLLPPAGRLEVRLFMKTLLADGRWPLAPRRCCVVRRRRGCSAWLCQSLSGNKAALISKLLPGPSQHICDLCVLHLHA